jgi:hypothetical protein
VAARRDFLLLGVTTIGCDDLFTDDFDLFDVGVIFSFLLADLLSSILETGFFAQDDFDA